MTQQNIHKNGAKKMHKSKNEPSANARSKLPDDKRSCQWCKGNRHSRKDPPAKEAMCNFCHKKGHFEKACLFKHQDTKELKRQNDVDACL